MPPSCTPLLLSDETDDGVLPNWRDPILANRSSSLMTTCETGEMTTSKARHSQSQLFLVRVWLEDLGNGKTEWRGQVKHVLSGEVRYFRDWPILITILQEMIAKPEEAAQDTEE